MSASKFTLLCNSHKCRAKLSGFVWVTAYSHVCCGYGFGRTTVLEKYKRKYNEVLERLNERNRRYQKLQGLLDSLRITEYEKSLQLLSSGLVKPHSNPSFLAPEGDRFFSLGPENAKTFFQFSTPTRDQSFIKKNEV
uniref:Uncharacterized protein n=1 Tax=Sinocyclocheilus grahami TaxID=75366 RepID=A0A672M1Z4_SINGR